MDTQEIEKNIQIAERVLPKGKLYIITTEEIEIPKPEPKKYDLYGDYE
jgi:hypothetical protein